MKKYKLILTGGIANSFEWYDYALFGHFTMIIGQKFFPESDPSSALLQAFLVFAVGYLMRPLGGIFFGVIGDKFGRKTTLSLSIMCMSIPTAAIGFLPTYEQWGVLSTTLMIIARIMQGLSMGGALTGSVSFIIEHSPKNSRGFLGSVPMASICIGILLGSLVSSIVKNIFTEEQFNQWGWRIPFIMGVFIYFAGVYIKKHSSETPIFEETKIRGEIDRSPLKTTIKSYWFDMAISICINACGSIIFYLSTIYLVNYFKFNRGFPEHDVNNLLIFCYFIMIFMALFSGFISDIIGRKKIFIIMLISIIITSPILLKTMETGTFFAVSIAQIIISLFSAAYIGPEPALQAEFYPAQVRNTALSISYNTATSVFGGTTPYIIESLIQNTGTITSSVYFIIFIAILGLASLSFYKNRSLDDYKVHIANN